MLEPQGKNTAPAIALAALMIKEVKEEYVLLVLSSDHIIKDCESFRETILKGMLYACQGRLVTFGVAPTSPETGYGYIESFEELNDDKISSNIKKFIEKPKEDVAKRLIQDKHFISYLDVSDTHTGNIIKFFYYKIWFPISKYRLSKWCINTTEITFVRST